MLTSRCNLKDMMDSFYGESIVPSSKEELAGLEKKWTPAEVVRVLLEHMDSPVAAFHKLVTTQPETPKEEEAKAEVKQEV